MALLALERDVGDDQQVWALPARLDARRRRSRAGRRSSPEALTQADPAPAAIPWRLPGIRIRVTSFVAGSMRAIVPSA